MTAEIIAVKERLNECRAAMVRAQKLANDALELCAAREVAYVDACRRVRDMEKELERIKQGKWRLWKVF